MGGGGRIDEDLDSGRGIGAGYGGGVVTRETGGLSVVASAGERPSVDSDACARFIACSKSEGILPMRVSALYASSSPGGGGTVSI